MTCSINTEVVAWLSGNVTVLHTSTKLAYVRPVISGMGDCSRV